MFSPLVPFGGSTGLSRAGADIDPITALRREMDRLFHDFDRGGLQAAVAENGNGFLTPRVNVAETTKGLEVTVDLPGIDQKDIDISLSDGILTLKAEHKVEKEE